MNINVITPQSEKIILIPNVPIKIEEVDFLRKQAMRISRENNFEVEKANQIQMEE